MKKELQEKLFENYPKIFACRQKETRDNLMYFGIDTGDGWYWIIDHLCKSIQSYVDNNKKPQPVAFQVKEKYGTLRFYLQDDIDEMISGMIWLAEDLSGVTCEECGSISNVGKTSGWVKTICINCIHTDNNIDKLPNWKPIDV